MALDFISQGLNIFDHSGALDGEMVSSVDVASGGGYRLDFLSLPRSHLLAHFFPLKLCLYPAIFPFLLPVQ